MNLTIEQTRRAEHVSQLRDLVNEALATLVPETEPASLYEPVRYVLDSGGKRLRPVLLLLAANVFGARPEQALRAALAVEVFHNFTLVHDDIMDHADTRRGRPTVHTAWAEDTAILAGDYLMALSYDLLAQTETEQLRDLFQVYSWMVRRLCEGQALDKAFETKNAVSVQAYLGMIDGKTGALIRSVLEMGGIIGGASVDERQTLREIGTEVGRAFQMQDDLLDLVADDDRWGKAVGGDLMEGKKTYLLLRTLEEAKGEEYAWFARIIEQKGLPPAEVPEARRCMDALGILDETRASVRTHSRRALTLLEALPQGEAVDSLRWFVQRLAGRVH
ncbi:MAG TPA: polyprenyl synthetase family protein [Rhodothermales bacterium]|nr:polyprenyl synthetase family protein [Rhodothermales bacterium]